MVNTKVISTNYANQLVDSLNDWLKDQKITTIINIETLPTRSSTGGWLIYSLRVWYQQ